MYTKDVIQLFMWAGLGLFVTWGLFFSYLGFRTEAINPKNSSGKRRVTKAASIFAISFGVLWIILWVSAVAYNVIEIVGVL